MVRQVEKENLKNVIIMINSKYGVYDDTVVTNRHEMYVQT